MRHEVQISTSDGRRSIVIDDDFCHSLSVPIGDNCDVVSLFVASWIALLADSPLNAKQKPYRLYRRFLSRIQRDGIKATVLAFADLAHELVSRHSLMGTGTYQGDWIDGFEDTPVFFEYNRYYQTGDPLLVEYLYTFLNFGKKLDYVDEEFNEAAFRSWLGIEKRLDDLRLLESDTSALRLILSTVLPTFTWRDLRPKLGPGSVQERGIRGRIDKLRRLSYDALIDRFLLHGHLGMYGCGEEFGASTARIIPDPSKWCPARGVSSRVARLRFVPKNLKVSRSICMEPNTLMFFQQAVAARFVELIDGCSMSNFIDIRDQSRNRELALIGSYTSEIDTLDLSAASDSLSYELVKAVFPPSWQIPMRATRSYGVILPDGSIYPLKKFAPMGSALCFPTQCLLFASVCIYAACLYTYRVESVDVPFSTWLSAAKVRDVVASFATKFTSNPHQFQGLAVYGDDICVDRRLTDIIIPILDRLGFVVNREKSFRGSQAFRESCGGFYLNGRDITPTYFRVKGIRSQLGAEHVASQVHLINDCLLRGRFQLRRFLIHSLMTWEPQRRYRNTQHCDNPVPFVSDPDAFGILVFGPAQNKHLRCRYNQDLQRAEYRRWSIVCDYEIDPGDSLSLVDNYEYMRWWVRRAPEKTTGLSRPVSRSDTGGSRLRWIWTPLR